MNIIYPNTVLISVLVLLVLLFIGSIAVAISPQYVLSHFPKLFFWISRHWPGMKEGREFNRELGKELGISDARKQSLSICFVRIAAIIITLAAVFPLWWVLVHI